MKIIGLAYKKGVGKNTLAKFIMTHLRCESPGLHVREVSFAAKLKDVCFQLYGWAGLKRGIYYETHRDDKEVSLPLIGKSPRQLWIGVGNKLREVYQETWIDFALRGVSADVLIVTDVRFRNEAIAIEDMGGQLVRIDRPHIPKGFDPAEVDLDSWDDWDHIINNCGTLRDLNNRGITLAEDILRCLQNDRQNNAT